jgi:putative ABC transport system permease protein
MADGQQARMTGLVRDIVGAFRLMSSHRGFAGAAVVTVALAVGGTSAVFGIVYGVLFRPPPYQDAERLVRLWEVHPGAQAPIPGSKLSGPTYRAWSASAETVQDMAAFGGRDYLLALPDGAHRVRGTRVTPALFRLLGVSPHRGRFFGEADALPGAPPVVVLSDGFWRDRLASDPDVIGRSLLIDGARHDIVGVAPPGFAFPDQEVGLRDDRQAISLYTPLAVQATPGATVIDYTEVIARLKPGVRVAQAEAEGGAQARAVDRPMADLVFGKGRAVEVRVRSLVDHMTMGVRPALEVLAAAVTLVLLVACANLANLFLSRGSDRVRELTVRSALGASRSRLVRQLVVESLVISLIGGALGLLAGWGLIAAIPALAPPDFPRVDQIHMDGRFVGVAAFAAVVVGMLSAIVPAVRGSRAELTMPLRGGARSVGTSGRPVRRMLLGLEAAFAVVLLVGACLLARSFVALVNVDTGYNAAGVLSADVRLPDGGTQANTSQVALAIVERVRATPGVRAAGAGDMAPFGSMLSRFGFRLPGISAADGSPVIATSLRAVVTPGYAEALGMRLKEGRLLRAADLTSESRAILVNASFARTYFADGRPAVGRRFVGLFPRWLGADAVVEVVGVVDDMLPADLDGQRQAQIFVSQGANAQIGHLTLVVRTDGDPSALAPVVQSLVRHVAPGATVERMAPLAAKVSGSVAAPRFTTAVLASFAMLALALAATGLSGALSYDIAQRRREIGVRTALGATRGDVVRMIVREGLTPTGVGLLAGMLLATLLTRAMASALFGVTPLDVVAFSAAPLLLLVVACVACLIPARRAVADDPVDALRAE